MSEKVLGFYEKDALKDDVLSTNPFLLWHIEPKKLVPVNLKSESVTIEWLEKVYSNFLMKESADLAHKLKENKISCDYSEGYVSALNSSLTFIKEQPKKQAGEEK